MAAETANYLMMIALAAVLGAVAGAVSHFVRGWIGRDETPIYENGPIIISLDPHADSRFVEKHLVQAEWRDDGSWDPDSLRNLAYLTIAGAVTPIVAGLLGWGQRTELLAGACGALARFGLDPLFCR